MTKQIEFRIGDELTENGRIEGNALTIRLPADFPSDFRGQIIVQFESAKPCGCLESKRCRHDHSLCLHGDGVYTDGPGNEWPCGPDCPANLVDADSVGVDTDRDGICDNCPTSPPA